MKKIPLISLLVIRKAAFESLQYFDFSNSKSRKVLESAGLRIFHAMNLREKAFCCRSASGFYFCWRWLEKCSQGLTVRLATRKRRSCEVLVSPEVFLNTSQGLNNIWILLGHYAPCKMDRQGSPTYGSHGGGCWSNEWPESRLLPCRRWHRALGWYSGSSDPSSISFLPAWPRRDHVPCLI